MEVRQWLCYFTIGIVFRTLVLILLNHQYYRYHRHHFQLQYQCHHHHLQHQCHHHHLQHHHLQHHHHHHQHQHHPQHQQCHNHLHLRQYRHQLNLHKNLIANPRKVLDIRDYVFCFLNYKFWQLETQMMSLLSWRTLLVMQEVIDT